MALNRKEEDMEDLESLDRTTIIAHISNHRLFDIIKVLGKEEKITTIEGAIARLHSILIFGTVEELTELWGKLEMRETVEKRKGGIE